MTDRVATPGDDPQKSGRVPDHTEVAGRVARVHEYPLGTVLRLAIQQQGATTLRLRMPNGDLRMIQAQSDGSYPRVDLELSVVGDYKYGWLSADHRVEFTHSFSVR